MLILPNYCLHSFVWCVWVRTARPCISCLSWLCFCLFGLGLVISCCILLRLQGSSLLLLLFLVWRCCCLLFCLFWRLGCLRCNLLFLSSPLPSPWLSSGAFWSSQSCWSLSPDIWLYLRRSGCHTFGMAWLLARVFPPLHGHKGFGPVWALPSPPCCGCCSCASRCGAEVFALG